MPNNLSHPGAPPLFLKQAIISCIFLSVDSKSYLMAYFIIFCVQYHFFEVKPFMALPPFFSCRGASFCGSLIRASGGKPVPFRFVFILPSLSGGYNKILGETLCFSYIPSGHFYANETSDLNVVSLTDNLAYFLGMRGI